MNTTLLNVVRSEEERRNAPAVLEMQSEIQAETQRLGPWLRNFRQIIGGLKRIYRSLQLIDSNTSGKVVLPEEGHKYREVKKELLEAGIKPTAIFCCKRNEHSIKKKVFTWVILLKSLIRCIRIISTTHSKKYFVLILSYVCFKAVIKNRCNFKSKWIFIGDLSTYLIALSAACKILGCKVIYWQYSFLDFKHLPVKGDMAVILNEKGTKLSKLKTGGKIFYREITPPIELNLDKIDKGPIGVLLNVHATSKVKILIERIYKIFRRPIEIRMHPNSKLKFTKLQEDIKIADNSESLESFSNRISIGVCGNTQAQAKLLLLGTPVIQISGLDPLSYDFHNYVKNNIVFGLESIEKYSKDDLVEFYESKTYKKGLFGLIGPSGVDRKPILNAEAFIE